MAIYQLFVRNNSAYESLLMHSVRYGSAHGCDRDLRSEQLARGQVEACHLLRIRPRRVNPLQARSPCHQAHCSLAILMWLPLPESPRWCLRRGNEARARSSLLRINKGCKDYDLENEIAVINQEIAEGRALTEASSKFSYIAIFKGPNLRRLLISFGPFAWQQWSGVPVCPLATGRDYS